MKDGQKLEMTSLKVKDVEGSPKGTDVVKEVSKPVETPMRWADEMERVENVRMSFVDIVRKGSAEPFRVSVEHNRDINKGMKLEFVENGDDELCFTLEDVMEEQRY